MLAIAATIRLLVVDDHPLFREGLARTLGTEEGLEIVAQAEDGTTAVAQWERLRPDVALIDVSMPGIDGIETVRRLRARHPQAKVLMLTSSDMPSKSSSKMYLVASLGTPFFICCWNFSSPEILLVLLISY